MSWDAPGKVWDLESRTLHASFGNLNPAIWFHPDDNVLYVAEDGRLSIHELDTAAVLEAARTSVARGLTPRRE